jgi:hypothetical protein
VTREGTQSRRGDATVDDRVGVGLVGLGRMGHFHATNLGGRIPLAYLVRIVDADESVARDVSEELRGVEWSTDYADLLTILGSRPSSSLALRLYTPT